MTTKRTGCFLMKWLNWPWKHRDILEPKAKHYCSSLELRRLLFLLFICPIHASPSWHGYAWVTLTWERDTIPSTSRCLGLSLCLPKNMFFHSCHQLVVWTNKGDGIGFEGMDGPSEIQINLSYGWYPGSRRFHGRRFGEILKTSELLWTLSSFPFKGCLTFP